MKHWTERGGWKYPKWGRLMKDIRHWFDVKIWPLMEPGERIGIDKIEEEFKEFRTAAKKYQAAIRTTESSYSAADLRMLAMHREAELADLFITIVCYAHANGMNLKRAVYATLLKLQKRKWKKTNIPGLVRHVEE